MLAVSEDSVYITSRVHGKWNVTTDTGAIIGVIYTNISAHEITICIVAVIDVGTY